jgi:hypothetical protein
MGYLPMHLFLTQTNKPQVIIAGGEDGNRGLALIAVAIFVAAIFGLGFYFGRRSTRHKQ